MNLAFLITAYDQVREVRLTVDILRRQWKETKAAPIVIVISGDKERALAFPDDPLTRVVHLNDIVGPHFQTMVSTSIMRQITHGMLEIADLERLGCIDTIIHMHGDILLLNERGFFDELNKWPKNLKPVAADSVGEQGPYTEVLPGPQGEGSYTWHFAGNELMPQLFAVDHLFCKLTGFMYDMEVCGDYERVSTEWALMGNLHRATYTEGQGEHVSPYNIKVGTKPYEVAFNDLVHVVAPGRSQWDLHKHWGGFAHFGNSLHFSKEVREKRNLAAARAYGIDLSKW